MMMPVLLGTRKGIPVHYQDFIVYNLYEVMERRFEGEIGYLTISEKLLLPGETLRRAGPHVDGYYHGRCGAWGGGGGWGSVGNGMFTVSNTPHCIAYLGTVQGTPGPEGECEHLTLPPGGEYFEPGHVYWLDGACVHESLPVSEPTRRHPFPQIGRVRGSKGTHRTRQGLCRLAKSYRADRSCSRRHHDCLHHPQAFQGQPGGVDSQKP
jgi:hypothetical protein